MIALTEQILRTSQTEELGEEAAKYLSECRSRTNQPDIKIIREVKE